MAKRRFGFLARPGNESFAELVARRCADWAGSTVAFMVAAIVIATWALTGPYYRYSDTWQLVINTGTTIVTFLMVFLIQRAQNKDAQAIHLKLNELIAAGERTSNRLINAEGMSEIDLRALRDHYCKLVELAQHDRLATQSHSVEEAVRRHERKVKV